MLHTFSTQQWQEGFPSSEQQEAIKNLENGKIIFFPKLNFSLKTEEEPFLSSHYVDPHAKNISYQAACNKLWGVQHLTDLQHMQLKVMLKRFSSSALDLLKQLFPDYIDQILAGRTSFRPVQISNRKTSYRKDDKRLHVDAFPSAPNQGKRILRVFCNINPHGEDRVWRIGEPFEKVANRFLPKIKKPLPGKAELLRFLKITKTRRTLYDHYMLNIHDHMKADEHYQTTVAQEEVRFSPGSSWIVQTDHVSHAAMSGQHVLEQTFYLPITAMQDESKSPIRVLEKLLRKELA